MRQTKLLKAPRTRFRVLGSGDRNIASLATLASWRFKVFLGSGFTYPQITQISTMLEPRSVRRPAVVTGGSPHDHHSRQPQRSPECGRCGLLRSLWACPRGRPTEPCRLDPDCTAARRHRAGQRAAGWHRSYGTLGHSGDPRTCSEFIPRESSGVGGVGIWAWVDEKDCLTPIASKGLTTRRVTLERSGSR